VHIYKVEKSEGHLCKLRLTSHEVVEEIDRLLDQYNEVEIAEILNRRGYRSGKGCLFSTSIVSRIRSRYGLKNRFDRMREAGLLINCQGDGKDSCCQQRNCEDLEKSRDVGCTCIQ
jgi:hypothetical protein